MSQTNAAYLVGSVKPVTVRNETLRNQLHWVTPTPEEIAFVLSQAAIQWKDLPALTGTPENRVEGWKAGIRPIDYLAWRYICERAGYGRIDHF
ncbi:MULTISPECIES: hypothetical protein [Citrobacter]|uniref:hypothetical protein n=1 Tax=Citrobacter TaxID=544 RepID=UPI00257922AD|nr:hypothetical protein [Citrobacter sp. Cpo150]MDM2765687.1 hypothetical protein [Citrobacter sp. Cpo150]